MNKLIIALLLVGVFNLKLASQEVQQKPFLVNAHSSPQLFNEVNIQANELVSFQIQDRSEGLLQKAVVLPFLHAKKRSILRYTRLNWVQYANISTLGLGYGIDLINKTGNESSSKNKFLQLNFGFNVALFPNWGSPSRDTDGDSLRDNQYSTKSKTASLGLMYHHGDRIGIQFSTYYIKSRETPIENTKEVSSIGYTLAFAKSLKESMKSNTISWNSLALDLGISFEHLLPIENGAELANGNAYELAATPFVNFGISSILNLKINAPFHLIEGKQDERGFGSFFQLYMRLP